MNIRNWQFLISPANNYRSFTNGLAVAALLAGMVCTLVPATAAAPAVPTTITGSAPFLAIDGATAGQIALAIGGQNHVINLANGDDLAAAVALINDSMAAYLANVPGAVVANTVVASDVGGALAMENAAGLDITVSGNAPTLGAAFLEAGVVDNGSPATEASAGGYRAFIAGDALTDLAIACTTAKVGEQVVFVVREAEANGDLLTYPEASRDALFAALEDAGIILRWGALGGPAE